MPAKSLAVFTRQLSVMIDAGLPLVHCLDILGRQEPKREFAVTILTVRRDIEAGAALAAAMQRHPRTFDPLFTNLIAAGEAGGILDIILKRLAGYIEKNVKLKRDVTSALIYPTAVLFISMLVVGAVLWKVIPTFATLFQGLGAQLPLPTRLVLAASDALIAYGWIGGLGISLAVVSLKRHYRSRRGREAVDRMLLKTPLAGALLRKVAVARFCRTLSTLLGSGVPILQALEITARSSGNAVVECAILTTRSGIERGESIASPLRQTGVFPPLVVQMINVGESTGALDTMLSKIADFYEEEVDAAVRGMLTLLEPALVAFLGIVVGGLVLAMYLPIFDLIHRMG